LKNQNNTVRNDTVNLNPHDAPANTFTKRIGRGTYNVHIYFSTTSKESINDKLLRIIKNDIANGAFEKSIDE
jgi:hypothetical protein